LIAISRFAGRMPIGASAGAPAGGATATVLFLKDGMNFETGSLSRSFPSSMRIMAAVLVMAFDIDAMRKIASVCIGELASMSRLP